MLFEGQGQPGSLNHLGVETESADEIRWEWYVKTGDSDQFGSVVVGSGGGTCCPG